MITASFLKCGMTNNLDGTEDDLVYNSTDNTVELDDSFVQELFASDSESDFEGFIVLKTLNIRTHRNDIERYLPTVL